MFMSAMAMVVSKRLFIHKFVLQKIVCNSVRISISVYFMLKMNNIIMEKADSARKKLIPTKSADRYLKEMEIFRNWRQMNDGKNIDENVILAYVSGMSKNYGASSVWPKISMLKTMLLTHENVDISSYAVVKSFMKRNGSGHTPKQAKFFTRDNIQTFLRDAPDDDYLPVKIATIFGIFGGCRREELYCLTVDAIVDIGSSVIVSIPKTKTGRSRTFTVVNGDGINYLDIVRKYKNMRPQHVPHSHFFISCRKGKCTVQRIGINMFGDMGKKVAVFLKLAEPSLYTGHAFRRSSATLLADSGADISMIKRHGGWKSTSVAERYVEDSLGMKTKIAKMIEGSTSLDVSVNNVLPKFSSNSVTCAQHSFGGFKFENLQGCTFNLNFNSSAEMSTKGSFPDGDKP